MRTAELFDLQANAAPQRKYWDKTNFASYEDQQLALAESTTVYVGNLSYYTSEQHVYELARQAGPIKKVIMGLHREKKTPCGFAFVEYFSRSSSVDAASLLTGKTLEGRVLKLEMDPGFKEGRQFGRGRGGGQVRDDFREEDDPERGGVGSLASAGLLPHQQQLPPPNKQFTPFNTPATISVQPSPFGMSQASTLRNNREEESWGDSRGKRGRYNSTRESRFNNDDRRGGRTRSRDNRRQHGNSGQRGYGDSRRGPPASTAPQAPMVDEFGRDIAPQ